MSGLWLSRWTVGGLLALSIAVTLLADWIVAGLKRPTLAGTRGTGVTTIVSLLANLAWILLVWGASVLAVRYLERLGNPAAGYALYALVVFSFSLVRARLYRRISQERATSLVRGVVHNLTYLLAATLLYLVLSLIVLWPVDPLLFIALWLGALVPELDRWTAGMDRVRLLVSRWTRVDLGHLQEWHSLGANVLVALITLPLLAVIGLHGWALIWLGFLSHLSVDLFDPRGLMLFWPLSRRRYYLPGFKSPGGVGESRLAAILALVVVVLLFVVEIAPAPAPPVQAPSFEQSLQSYYSMRGRNLVFARVEGSWQATGRWMSGTFEVLNAADSSLVLLDRYDGSVFTAGRSAADNLYVSALSLSKGRAARVKPVEVHLQDQRLAEALPTVYQMQREPGLQHIFVSGDVLLPLPEVVAGPSLQADYAQTLLRKVQVEEAGHYVLRYLTASELTDLANIEVESADLVIVATYATPATGPTVTPLPEPPPTPAVAP
jgi:inner membrane protein